MATGDQQDFINRLKAVLPAGWFGNSTPVLDAVLNGIAWSLALVYGLAAYARLQTRIATASDGFLDLVSYDYFGPGLPRKPQETDASFRNRILAALLQERGTRRGLIRMLEMLTGRTPWVFEPARPEDTGGYDVGGCGYDLAGGYGAIDVPYQAFVIAYRPTGQGIPNMSGYDSGPGGYDVGGQLAYTDLSQMVGAVTDEDIYQAIDSVKPAGTTIWAQIQS